jgi:hypothetical protein
MSTLRKHSGFVDRVADALKRFEEQAGTNGHVGVLLDHVVAMGARMTMLETDRDEWQRKALERNRRVTQLANELARLKPSGQVAEDAHSIKAVIWAAMVPPITVEQADAALARLAAGAQEAEALRGKAAELEQQIGSERAYRDQRIKEVVDDFSVEVERLKTMANYWSGRMASWQTRATVAESRLAAIRERGADDAEALRRAEAAWVGVQNWDADVHADVLETGHLVHLGDAVRRAVRWILEGDAPQEASTTSPCICGFLSSECAASRHPCSPSCTHDDAATPGHSERIASLSIAFDQPMPETGVLTGDEPRPERGEAIDDAAMGRAIAEHNRHVDSMAGPPHDDDGRHPERAKERSEAVKELPLEHQDPESVEAHMERAAEAMRAACLWEVRNWAQRVGLGEYEMDMLKAVIEGAVP